MEAKTKVYIHTICPTRWTVRGEACAAIIDNHPYLMQLWEETLDGKIDNETQAKIIGAQTTMKTFNFLFSCSLNKRILCQTDQLSKRLQGGVVTAAEGADLATNIVAMMRAERNDDSFQVFWEQLEERRVSLEIDEPTLPRGSIHANPEAHFRSVYMQAYDNKAECIVSRFDQQDFLTYKNIQDLFLKSVRGESYTSELQTVCEIYRDDIKQDEIYCKIDY